MTIISVKQINKLTQAFIRQKVNWHFHLLTPNCQLNKQKQHAFFVENNSNNKTYIAYTQTPQLKLGQRLLAQLHDVKVGITPKAKASLGTQKILSRIKQLTQQNKNWHHHMLLPECIFNPKPGKWTIMFEDQEKGEVLYSHSQNEPKNDLQVIETLYYQQRTIK